MWYCREQREGAPDQHEIGTLTTGFWRTASNATDENEFLLAFFTRLFARWQTALSAEQQEELAHSILLGVGQGLRRGRRLAGLVQDFPLRRILNQYTEAGPWGHIFDGEPGDNDDHRVRVYETRGLTALGERAAAPAVEWLGGSR
jgi:hypothetical protein